MELTPEIKAQLQEQKKNCPYCLLLKGEIPSSSVYEDKYMNAVMHIDNWREGHILLLPKEHYPILPLMPADEFKHIFGSIPKLIKALKKSFLSFGCNVIIANGGAAGQQLPHFCVNIVPRDTSDKFDYFSFNKPVNLDQENLKSVNEMLHQNVPIMMNNHFGRNPAKWHNGNIKRAEFIEKIENQKIIYEDEKSIVLIPKNPQCIGHMVIYSQEEEKLIEKLSDESSSHLFYVASFCSTAAFEGLKAAGSNIILKSGKSKDNLDGGLEIHILPRFEKDKINLNFNSNQDPEKMELLAKKIKENIWLMQTGKPKKRVVIDLDKEIPEEIIKNPDSKKLELKKPINEIEDAISKIQKS